MPDAKSRRHRVGRFVATLASAAVAVGLASCGSGSGADIQQPGPGVGTAIDRPIPDSIAKLQLTTDTGSHVTIADFRGKTVLLTDFLTLCSDACPLVSQELADIDRQVQASGMQDKVQLLELTVDPKRDTPARLAAYRKIYRAPANWSLLTAPQPTIDAIWKYFGVYYRAGAPDEPGETDWWTGKPVTYDVDHSDDAIFIDTAGRWRFLIDGLPNVKGEELPAAMRDYLDALGDRHLNQPKAGAWTTAQGLSVLSWLTGTRIG